METAIVLGVHLRRLIDQPLADHLAELRRIRVTMLLNRVTDRHREHLLFGARDRKAAVPLAGHPPAIDHLPH